MLMDFTSCGLSIGRRRYPLDVSHCRSAGDIPNVKVELVVLGSAMALVLAG